MRRLFRCPTRGLPAKLDDRGVAVAVGRGADLDHAARGTLAGRYGERAFTIAGLALQALGLGWVAAIAAAGMSYPEFGSRWPSRASASRWCSQSWPTACSPRSDPPWGSTSTRDLGLRRSMRPRCAGIFR
jgi:hypothetical protein